MTARVLATVIALAFIAHPYAKGADKPEPKVLSKDARTGFFRAAQVWTPTSVGEFDLRAGPAGKDAFAPDEVVECDHVEKPKMRADSASTQRKTGGLSTLMKPPGSNDAKKKFFHENVIERTAAA